MRRGPNEAQRKKSPLRAFPISLRLCGNPSVRHRGIEMFSFSERHGKTGGVAHIPFGKELRDRPLFLQDAVEAEAINRIEILAVKTLPIRGPDGGIKGMVPRFGAFDVAEVGAIGAHEPDMPVI